MSYSNFTMLNGRILTALQSGADFTANQLRNRFGIEAVSARISELRKAGYAIYLNTRTTANGRTIKTYRLGSPKRSTVVAGLAVEQAINNGATYVFASEISQSVNQRLALVN